MRGEKQLAIRFLIDTRHVPVQFECSTAQGRILQNAKNLLMTRMGDVPYDRLRGLDAGVYDKPIPFVKSHIMQEISRVLAWEPDVRLISVDIRQEVEGTVFLCEVEVEEEPEGRESYRKQ